MNIPDEYAPLFIEWIEASTRKSPWSNILDQEIIEDKIKMRDQLNRELAEYDRIAKEQEEYENRLNALLKIIKEQQA